MEENQVNDTINYRREIREIIDRLRLAGETNEECLHRICRIVFNNDDVISGILTGIYRGDSTSKIAKNVNRSRSTVKRYIKTILIELQVAYKIVEPYIAVSSGMNYH